jgi:hypothetical protein
VALAVAHAQGVNIEAVSLREGGCGGRVHPATQEDHGLGRVMGERRSGPEAVISLPRCGPAGGAAQARDP